MERHASFVSRLHDSKKSEIVLKVKFGTDPLLKNSVEREKAALDILKGLAVPKRITVKRNEIAKLLKEENFFHIAMEWVPWKGCFGRSFPTEQALGVWAFTIEQMCAFRRKSVLYTDFKHNHLRLADDLSGAMIVDFDGCLMVEPKGLYPTDYLGFTAELAPPEFQFAKVQTERVMVYQMGMFLGSLLLKYFHNSDLNPESFKKIEKKLTKESVKGVYRVFEKCLSKNPLDRPRDLEALYYQIQQVTLPSVSYKVWANLRAPYQKQLSKLGFKEPKIQSIKTHFKVA